MKLIPGAPAAVVGDALVLAELHLGVEFSLHERGARVFPDAKKQAREVNKLLKLAKVDKIIFLGDLKQDVKGFEQREKKLVQEFLSLLQASEKILVKGNHDAQVEGIAGLQVTSPEGIVVDDFELEGKVTRLAKGEKIGLAQGGRERIGLAHGHAWPSKEVLSCKTVCVGHTHPVVEFVDANGSRRVRKVWLSGQVKFGDEKARETAREHGLLEGTKIVVFPAFSNWVGGMAVNARYPAYPLLASGQRESSKKRDGLLGPLFSNGVFDLDNALCHTLDGVELGKVSSLRGLGGERYGRLRRRRSRD